jgi:hypothetical protein
MFMTNQQQEQSPHPDEKSEFVPRGITVFLTLMLVVYALYWAYLWFITTIERGVGG